MGGKNIPNIGQMDSESTVDVDNPPSSFDSSEQPADTPLEQNIPQLGQMEPVSSIDVGKPSSSLVLPEQPADTPHRVEQNIPQIGQMDSSESEIDVDNHIPEQTASSPHPAKATSILTGTAKVLSPHPLE